MNAFAAQNKQGTDQGHHPDCHSPIDHQLFWLQFEKPRQCPDYTIEFRLREGNNSKYLEYSLKGSLNDDLEYFYKLHMEPRYK